MLPRVSVITVAKNAASTIRETIESVLQQDYPNIEYVLVDGRSTDGTTAVVEEFRSRIAFFVSEQDAGVYFGMQKGVQLSTGSMILLLNADDTFADSGSLSSLVEARLACKADGPVICYSDYMKYYPKLDRSFVVAATGDLQQGMGLLHQAMLADRGVYDLVGGFDPSFRVSADYEWVIRAKRLGVHFVKAPGPPTAIFRQGGLSDTQYHVSRSEAARIIRREYGRLAYTRYVATQRWRFCLRVVFECFELLFGRSIANRVHVVYLRKFRGHRELHPADR